MRIWTASGCASDSWRGCATRSASRRARRWWRRSRPTSRRRGSGWPMDREELAKMKLEALRLLAAERGVDGARSLGKAELIEHLAPKTIVERAKEAVAHAVEVVEEKAHELADKVKHHRKDAFAADE